MRNNCAISPPVDLEPVIFCPRYAEKMLLSTCETRRSLFGLDDACTVCVQTYGGEA